MTLVSLTLAWSLVNPQPAPSTQELATPAQIRQALSRSLPFLETGGLAWIKERKCTSCHFATFMLWGHNAARAAGVPVDEQKLTAWTQWQFHFGATATGKGEADAGVDTRAQLLLLRDPALLDAQGKQHLETIATVLIGQQQADGSWLPGGQLPRQRRPAPETKIITAQWAVLALQSVENPSAAVLQSKQRALAWLQSARPGQSAESHVTHLLVERQLGDPARAREVLQELLKRQNADGGWAWLQGEASDSLATGMVLYALSYAGRDEDRPAVNRAQTFLVRTQRANGSWYAPTTKVGKKGDNDGMGSYWGTGWATIGLARTLR